MTVENSLSRWAFSFAFFCLLLVSPAAANADEKATDESAVKKIVLIAGKKSHGPLGNGIHDYPWSVKLLKVMLDNSNIHAQLRVEYHLEGWPENPSTLEDADAIMVISDGRDGDKYDEAPHFQSAVRTELVARQIRRGCGFLTFHFSTFAPDDRANEILDWSGGYFDWEENGQRKWYSAIQTLEADVALATPSHPIVRGVKPFKIKDEFYYNLRFRPHDEGLTPLWSVAALPGREPDGRVVAWARQRNDGGRGFGTTAGHFYENWRHPDFRKTLLNAIAWCGQVVVPNGGVEADYYTREQIAAALEGVTGDERAVARENSAQEKSIRALVLTGAQYPGHLWQETTPAILAALGSDQRIRVDISEDIKDLATGRLDGVDVVILNYCNWKAPGLTDAEKAGFLKYLNAGGGLCIVHFANGAFHFSLPEAGESDWPEFRKICRRVWNHQGKSGHDRYGPFSVEIADKEHPIMAGMSAFETRDELYFRQEGELPIHVLAQAKSKVTGEFAPMAFVYEYGPARVFQTVLGHDAASLRTPDVAKLLRRATVWAARGPVSKEFLKKSEEKPKL